MATSSEQQAKNFGLHIENIRYAAFIAAKCTFPGQEGHNPTSAA
jgi:hypothetical protein